MNETANAQTIVRIAPAHHYRRYIIAGIVVAAVAIGAAAYFRQEAKIHAQNVAAANKVQMVSLQKKLNSDQLSGNFKSIASDTNSLIKGKLAGVYTFNNKQLAEYYMQAGVAYYSLKQYDKAVASYKAAPQYDRSLQMASLQGQVTAGYAAGVRQQLIPLLQQLANLTKNVHDPTSRSSQQYKYDIEAIQNNKEIEL